MRFVTDPRQARKVKMRDGTTYPVSPSGGFVITRADHLAEMNQGNREVYARAASFGGKGVNCPCGFVGWRWQRECPRCGHLLHS